MSPCEPQHLVGVAPRVYRLLSLLTKRKSEMAVSITSAVRSADGTLTITGTEFTKTTTTFPSMASRRRSNGFLAKKSPLSIPKMTLPK